MIDSLDDKLIDLLAENARVSSDKLAKQLNVSSSTVRRRIEKLIERGIVRIVASPEPIKMGLSMAAVIAFNVHSDKTSSLLHKLSQYRQVRWVAATGGRFDIMIYVWLNSTEDLYGFIENELAKLEGVRNTETFICLHVEKHT